MPKSVDLLGQTFGRLKVTATAERKGVKRRWECRCVCGSTVVVHASALVAGLTRSCGCLAREGRVRRMGSVNRRHGKSGTAEYRCWLGMLKRCYDPKNKSFGRYGGRGIKVCDRWRNSVVDFIKDVGPRPSPGHSLDRINNDGDYCPENCRWATKAEQSNNRRDSRIVEFQGLKKTITQWAQQLRMSAKAIAARLDHGWPMELALTRRARHWRRNGRWVSFRGQKKSVAEWARHSGISAAALRVRLNNGWPIEVALTARPWAHHHGRRSARF